MKKVINKNTKKEPGEIKFPNWKLLNKYSIYIVLLLTIIAFIVRIYRVGFLSVWLDEYMHINPAINLLHGKPYGQSDVNGIFLTWVITLFFKLFGISETVARIPSVIFGTLSIPLIYLLGKKLYNKYIGIIAAFLSAFSLYLICWSRLARNYPSFGFFYLLLIIIFWFVLNPKKKKDEKNSDNFLKRNIFLISLPFVFVLSLLNHQLTFFFLFSAATYILVKGIHTIVTRKPKAFTNIYSILSYIIIIGAVIFFIPSLLDSIARPILGILLPDRIINWVLPKWGYIIDKLKSEDAFNSFIVYYNVIKNDFSRIFYLGILGIPASFFIPKKRKEAIYLFSIFIVPLALMSFIFRDPSTPNYIYYIYPFFLIYIALFIYFLVERVVPLIISKSTLQKKWFNNLSILLVAVLLYISVPKKEIKSLINTKEHGQVVKKELFHSSFVNWKSLCQKIKPYVKKDDIVLSTWPSATNFYLERDNSVWFRQRRYDTKLRQYVNREPIKDGNSAVSVEDLALTMSKHKTGWLFADFYFDNVLTDPRARDFVIRNMDYHFNISDEGVIRLFSWDHNRPKKYQNTVLIELGRTDLKLASRELNFNLQTLANINKGIILVVEAEGIDKTNEAFVTINESHSAVIPIPNQIKNTTNVAARRTYEIFIKKSWLKQGKNSLQFAYNKNIIDYPKGFVIYNINFKNQ